MTEARIEHICSMMRSFTWVRGRTGRRLAEEWGISYQRVRELSAEASKRVKAGLSDPSRTTVDVCAALQSVVADALADARNLNRYRKRVDENGEIYTLSPDRMAVASARRAVIDAGRTWADIVGATAAVRLKVGIEDPTKASDERLEQLALEALRTMEAKKKGDGEP